MKKYICYMEYEGTGDGLSHTLSLVDAKDEDSARQRFLRTRVCHKIRKDDKKYFKESMEYFSSGVEVYDLAPTSEHREKIKEILKKFFNRAVAKGILARADDQSLHELELKTYTNCN